MHSSAAGNDYAGKLAAIASASLNFERSGQGVPSRSDTKKRLGRVTPNRRWRTRIRTDARRLSRFMNGKARAFIRSAFRSQDTAASGVSVFRPIFIGGSPFTTANPSERPSSPRGSIRLWSGAGSPSGKDSPRFRAPRSFRIAIPKAGPMGGSLSPERKGLTNRRGSLRGYRPARKVLMP